jgi:hypothetical protein
VIEIGNGARDAQDAIVRAGREVHSANRHLESPLTAVIECAEGSKLCWRDLRIIEAALALRFAGLFHALPYVG